MSANLKFWEDRYRSHVTPWDSQGVPPALSTYLGRSPPGSVLIPGCGFGYEVNAFHAAGWHTLAFDFSPAAVEQAKVKLGPLGLLVKQADFFVDDLGGPYDLIYERTFLCALAPKLWPTYVERIRQLLRPDGVLAGFFFYGVEEDGPPNPFANVATAQSLFTGFELITDEPVPAHDSLPLFADRERWQEWKNIG